VKRGTKREQKCGFSPKVKKITMHYPSVKRGTKREQKCGFSPKVKKITMH
jgi:glutaredoxin-related protein